MLFKEIIELAKKRGLQTGKAKRANIVEAFESGRTCKRDDDICIGIDKDS
jgi:hypothetical protein